MLNGDFWSAFSWIAIGAAVMAWQLSFCFLFKRVLLRLIPTLAAVLATATFFVLMLVGEGWAVLGYLIWMILCAIMLGLCLVCWLVFAVVCTIKRRKRRPQNTLE